MRWGARTPGPLTARPLAVALRHELQIGIIWHVNTDPATVEAFTARIQQALAWVPLFEGYQYASISG
jgi:hypothetical protein